MSPQSCDFPALQYFICIKSNGKTLQFRKTFAQPISFGNSPEEETRLYEKYMITYNHALTELCDIINLVGAGSEIEPGDDNVSISISVDFCLSLDQKYEFTNLHRIKRLKCTPESRFISEFCKISYFTKLRELIVYPTYPLMWFGKRRPHSVGDFNFLRECTAPLDILILHGYYRDESESLKSLTRLLPKTVRYLVNIDNYDEPIADPVKVYNFLRPLIEDHTVLIVNDYTEDHLLPIRPFPPSYKNYSLVFDPEFYAYKPDIEKVKTSADSANDAIMHFDNQIDRILMSSCSYTRKTIKRDIFDELPESTQSIVKHLVRYSEISAYYKWVNTKPREFLQLKGKNIMVINAKISYYDKSMIGYLKIPVIWSQVAGDNIPDWPVNGTFSPISIRIYDSDRMNI